MTSFVLFLNAEHFLTHKLHTHCGAELSLFVDSTLYLCVLCKWLFQYSLIFSQNKVCNLPQNAQGVGQKY